MKKLVKFIITLTVLIAASGGIYYFWKNKMGNNEESDDFDDFDDFDDLDDFDEDEDKEEEKDTEEERGYVTLKLHKEEEEETAAE